jgi:hypothetical protein
MRKNIVPPFIIYCRSDRQRKPNGAVYLTTFWLFRLRAPDEKDYKTVLAFFAEERIKFSSILVGISVPRKVNALFISLSYGEPHKISIKKKTQHIDGQYTIQHYKFAMHSCLQGNVFFTRVRGCLF